MTIVPMTAAESAITGLQVITTKAISDERGTIREFFRVSEFAQLGVDVPARWSQINMTWTHHGGLRGLHGEPMTKLVGVAHGSAFGAYLDTRPESPTYGVLATVELEVGTQVLVPAGVCNGFQATSQGGCQYVYCFDAEWTPDLGGIAVNPLDPQLGIAWPVPVDADNPAQLSAKDAAAPLFAETS
jgi:dTDP-4-dehydrorhamnose 3,5-epimerase